VLVVLNVRQERRPNTVSVQSTAPIPPPIKPVPPIPDGEGEASKRLASLARSVRDRVRSLPKVKTRRELYEAKQAIKAQTKELQSAGEAALPVLEPFLSDPRVDVRLHGLSTLGEMRQPYAAPLLAKAWQDENAGVRNAALMWIAQMRPRENETAKREALLASTRTVLFEALKSDDLATRRLARQALLSVTGRTWGYTADAPEPQRLQALAEIAGALFDHAGKEGKNPPENPRSPE